MTSMDLILMGLKNLWRRKTRTILTVLGVVIGTSSIVVMLSLGLGMEKAYKEEMERMGSLTVIDVNLPHTVEVTDSRHKSKNAIYLNDQTVELFENMEHVENTLASKRVDIILRVRKKQSWGEVNAVDFKKLIAFGSELASGRFPDKNESSVIIAGGKSGETFYSISETSPDVDSTSDLDLENSQLKAFLNGEYYGDDNKKRPFKLDVIGTLVGTDSWLDSKFYMSFYTYEQLFQKDIKKYGQKEERRRGSKEEGNIYDIIKVKIDKMENVIPMLVSIRALGFEAYGMAEWIDSEQKKILIIQAVLGGIGGVSLLIAAIGITNTMIMSIYERTREIGVMKVLGARLKDIKNLFLFEAAMIGLLGGMIGSVFSCLVSFGINKIFLKFTVDTYMEINEISYIPIKLIVLALVFSTFIGIISGYYPARRAMRLSALKAISTN